MNNDERLRHLVKTLFNDYLNAVEESEGGKLFFPTTISTCRAMKIAPLNNLLEEMRQLSGADTLPEIDNER